MFLGISRIWVPLCLLALAPAGYPLAAESGSRLPLLPAAAFDRAAAAHLLSRAGFGGTPEEIDRLAAQGLEGAVESLLNLSGADPLPPFQPTVTERPSRAELARLTPEERKKAFQDHQRKEQEQFQALRAWWVRRMVVTSRPLEEKMTLFWHGHFTSSQKEVKNSYHMYLQNQTLRTHALGNFKELVRLMAKDPAMLQYLNNNKNVRRAPNENFARELMELFTLGVGNYTEKDVKEGARALTGWTVRGNEFVFAERSHDPDEKSFLGKRGRFTGDDVIDIIFQQPAASRLIVRKLFVFFAHDDPPPSVLEPLAAILRESRFELRPVLSQLFRSAEFYSSRTRANQFKSPVQLVVGTLRLLQVDPGDSPAMASLAGRMGQDLFQPPNVKGWDGGKSWISTSTLFDRYNFSRPVLGLEGRKDPPRRPAAHGRPEGKMVVWDLSAGAKAILGEEPGKLKAAEVVERVESRFLLSPLTPDEKKELIDFYEKGDSGRRLPELLHLVFSSPHYQLD